MKSIARHWEEQFDELIKDGRTGQYRERLEWFLFKLHLAVQAFEKRALTKHSAKRQRRLELLITGTAGMYGDLQGIVGRSMPELHGLQIPRLGEGMDL